MDCERINIENNTMRVLRIVRIRRLHPISTKWSERFVPKFWLICLAALCLLNCIGTAMAAQYRLQAWTVDNGLPQNVIRGVAQTPDGYLWITTLDGLARFDGVRFTVFNKSNTSGISSNRFGS